MLYQKVGAAQPLTRQHASWWTAMCILDALKTFYRWLYFYQLYSFIFLFFFL